MNVRQGGRDPTATSALAGRGRRRSCAANNLAPGTAPGSEAAIAYSPTSSRTKGHKRDGRRKARATGSAALT